MGDRLSRPAVALLDGILEATAAPPAMKRRNRDHQSPKMPEVAGAHQFAGLAKETLAKKRAFAYPWHRVFPPSPGRRPGGFCVHQYGRKDPFSLQDQFAIRVLAPTAFTV
jgi:hypothetical protein